MAPRTIPGVAFNALCFGRLRKLGPNEWRTVTVGWGPDRQLLSANGENLTFSRCHNRSVATPLWQCPLRVASGHRHKPVPKAPHSLTAQVELALGQQASVFRSSDNENHTDIVTSR